MLVRDRMPAWAFMWALAFAIFTALKWMTWWQAGGRVWQNPKRSLAYLLAWPGMDADTFLDPQAIPSRPSRCEWSWAFFKTLVGAALLWVITRQIPRSAELLRGWVGLLGLILLLHFGSFHLIALFWRTLGIKADPIMNEPLKSQNLGEFWGKRWNLGFRQLGHELIFRPLQRQVGATGAGFLVFIVSGLIHDMVISVPARGGYGLPTAYFTLQGLGVMLERSHLGHQLGLRRGFSGWLFTLLMTAGPVFWLFHRRFVLHVIIPFMHAIHAI